MLIPLAIKMRSVTASDVWFRCCSAGAACNVLYINSVEMESLTGPEALSRAIDATFSATSTSPPATDVHFKVSSLGITLTDNKHRSARPHSPPAELTSYFPREHSGICDGYRSFVCLSLCFGVSKVTRKVVDYLGQIFRLERPRD